ncbi:hypothetical protein MKZ17_07890 [Solibacillus sp. FSL R7-0682]|uniref:phage tail protein n=1 Tax=Solibacillus sp. FSL R7-0682 TaxID=2921690 RepID=UPI0030F8AE09
MATTLEELQILITTETAGLRRELGRVRSELNTMDNAVKKSTDAMKNAFKAVAAAIAGLAIGKYIKDAVMAASDLEGAFLGLQSIIEGQGRSFSKAKAFINDYIADGLVPLTDAVNAYKNLAARGYNDEQIQQVMERLKDAAAFGRQSSYTLGAAVASATEGLKNENSILVDNAGVTKNVAKMWEEYAASIGKTSNNLSQQEKILAEVNGIMIETQFQVGDAAKYADTFAGRLAYLNKTLSDIQGNIGAAFMPIANAVIPLLQKLANWLVKVTAYFKYFMQAFFGVSKSQKETSISVGAGTSAQENYGDAAEKAGKKAKKAAKEAKGALAGFDEINQLSQSGSSGSDKDKDSGEGGGVDAIDFGGLDDMEIDTETIPANIQKMVDDIKKSIDDLKTKMSDIGSKFKEAFSGMGTALQPLRDAVGPIKQSLGEMGQSLVQLVDQFLKPMAGYLLFDFIPSIVTGFVKDFAPILADVSIWGMDLAARTLQNSVEIMVWLWNGVLYPSLELIKNAFLVASSSIAKSMQSLLDGTIKPLTEFLLNKFLLPVVNSLTRTFVPIFTDVIVFALELAAKTFKNLSDTLNSLTTTVILPAIKRITDAFLDIVPRIGGALQNLLNGTLKPFVDYILNGFAIPIANEIIKTVVPIFTDVLVAAFEATADAFEWAANLMNDIYNSVIKPTFDLVKKIVIDTLKIVQDTWTKYGSNLMKNLKDLFENIQDIFQSLWDKVLKPIVEPFLEKLTWLWDKHIKDLIKQIAELVMKMVNAALEISNKFITPIVKFLIDVLAPGFTRAFNFIVDLVTTVIATLSDLIKNYMKVLGGLLDFVTGVFTGNWRKAWQGVSDIFGGIIGGITSIFKGVINILIDTLNAFFRVTFDGINSVLSGAANIANKIPGVNISVGAISVPRIPKLARGGIVDGATNFGNYIAGEAGAEMIVPLENTPFVDKLASALGTAVMKAMQMSGQQSGGNDGGDIVLNVDGTTFARILNPYLAKEGQRLGSTIIQPI